MDDLTVSQWREAVRNADQDDDGASAEELATAFGCGVKTARQRIRRAVRAGNVTVGWRRCKRMDGIPYRCPVYKLTEVP